VSEITTANAASLSVAGGTQIVPALTVRRAETTVELGSGESFAIAGLLHDTTSDSSSGLPGLADTPILGSLFRTSRVNRTQLELVIVVTPVIVRPVRNMAQLQIPADGFKPMGDVDRMLLLRQTPNANGTYNAPRAPSEAGFIVR
jgi:pilus assembly protein CpaC